MWSRGWIATDELSPRDRPALAPNWRTVLLVDAGVGALLFFLGVLVSIAWSVVVGAFLEATGILYVLLVGRRWRRWASFRRIMLDGVDG